MVLALRERDVLEKVMDAILKEITPARILLFGSRAKGESGSGSDFDLAIDAKRPDFSREVRIKEAIGSVCGLYSVDIVFLPSLDDNFRKLVLKTGRPVYEKRAPAKR